MLQQHPHIKCNLNAACRTSHQSHLHPCPWSPLSKPRKPETGLPGRRWNLRVSAPAWVWQEQLMESWVVWFPCFNWMFTTHICTWFHTNIWGLDLETRLPSGLSESFWSSMSAVSNWPIISASLDDRVKRLSVNCLNFVWSWRSRFKKRLFWKSGSFTDWCNIIYATYHEPRTLKCSC